MFMGFNFVTDPDDLLRKIPPNITRDVESVVRRIKGLLPSIYRGLERVLEKVRPGSPEWTRYSQELSIVKEILKFLDNPGKSYLIGVPFQVVLIEDNNVYAVVNMSTPAISIEVLGPTKCTILIFPITTMYPDNILRSAFVHELVHCAVGDIHETRAYKVEEMLTDLAPDLFLAMHTQILLIPISRVVNWYAKKYRVPVISHETYDIVIDRIATDPEYARQILRRSVVMPLIPSIFWRFWRRPASSTP